MTTTKTILSMTMLTLATALFLSYVLFPLFEKQTDAITERGIACDEKYLRETGLTSAQYYQVTGDVPEC